MRHFTWYTVNVYACRAKQGNESDEDVCSERGYNTFRTQELCEFNRLIVFHLIIKNPLLMRLEEAR